MDSFIVDLVSNASTDIYPNNTLSSFTNFLPDQISLEGDWEVALMEVAHPSLYHNVTNGIFTFKRNQFDLNTDDDLQIPPGLYRSIDELLHAMRDKILERYIDKTPPFTWQVDRITQKLEITLEHLSSILVIKSNDLCHILGFQCPVYLSTDGPHIGQYHVDIVHWHALMIYTNVLQHVIVGDTKAPLLRSFPFVTKLRNDEIVTGQFMNYMTFANPQFKKI